jgi:hypothetical protein
MNKKKLLDESIENIKDDRVLALELLNELRAEISNGLTSHGQAGNIAAKYVETLQRSNEQIVKLLTLLQKEEKGKYDTSLNEEETNNIFELIQAETGEK